MKGSFSDDIKTYMCSSHIKLMKPPCTNLVVKKDTKINLYKYQKDTNIFLAKLKCNKFFNKVPFPGKICKKYLLLSTFDIVFKIEN